MDKKKYFDNLDGLRFILAFAVFGSHSMLSDTINEVVPVDALKKIVTVFTSGHLAVSFFFVLSGFLITYLMIEEKEISGTFHLKNFYIRRIFRIWPVYFAVLLFGFFIYPYIKTQIGYIDKNPYSFVYQILFLGNFDSIRIHDEGLVDIAPMMIGITWSVSIEEQFYLFWPILFIVTKPKRFWIACIIVIILSWVFRLNTANKNLYYHTLSVISDMGIGGLGAYLAFYSKLFIRFFQGLSRYSILLIYILGFLMLMYADNIFSEYFVTRSYRILTALFFCFIIIEQSFASNSLFKLGSLKTITAWGKYTYALYMLHPIGIQTSIIVFRYMGIQRDENTLLGLLYVLIAFVISMVLSVFSYQYVERYFLEKRKLFY